MLHEFAIADSAHGVNPRSANERETMTPVQKRLSFYKALMIECRARLEVIHSLFQQPPSLPAQAVHEICYLQLRMLCEAITIGGLLLHEELPNANSTRLLKTWEADKLMKALADLNPHFYPQPAKSEVIDGVLHFDRRFDLDCLAQEELPVLWQKCGSKLHKGGLKKFLTRKTPLVQDREEIARWQRKIVSLLNVHAICASPDGSMYLVQLGGPNNEPQVAFAASLPGPTCQSQISEMAPSFDAIRRASQG